MSTSPENTTVDVQPMIRIISGPGCMQCKMTKRALFEKHGVDERLVEMLELEDPGVREVAESTGLRALPIVTYNGEHWGGFTPAKIEAAAPALKAATAELHAKEAALSAEADVDDVEADDIDNGPSF